jgi:hypothetical protein
MSLVSSIILPKLEAELLKIEPELASFILNQLKSVASEVVQWAEEKVHLDLNSDGTVGV